MFATIVWALLTGLITGGAWVGIVLIRHRRQLARLEPELLDDLRRRVAGLEGVASRLGEVEERLDFAERLLRQRDEARRVSPPSTKRPVEPAP